MALPDGSVFLDRALQRHVRFPPVYRAFCRNIGRHGSTAAGRLLVAAADRADSAAERLLVRLLRDAGIGGWVLGHPFGPWRIDLAFPQQKVAVEVDGWAWHVDAERFRTDRRKQNALVRDGLGPAALHLARPRRAAGGGRRRDPGNPAHDRRFGDMSCTDVPPMSPEAGDQNPALLTICRYLPA